MADKITLTKKSSDKMYDHPRNPSINKAFSDRPTNKQSYGLSSKASSQALPEAITYILMKEKFEEIYKHIEKISIKDEQLLVKINKIQKQELEAY